MHLMQTLLDVRKITVWAKLTMILHQEGHKIENCGGPWFPGPKINTGPLQLIDLFILLEWVVCNVLYKASCLLLSAVKTQLASTIIQLFHVIENQCLEVYWTMEASNLLFYMVM